MTPKRYEAILASLREGNGIHRHWVGDVGGRLKHRLEGIRNLKESEFEELRRDMVIRVDPPPLCYVLSRTT